MFTYALRNGSSRQRLNTKAIEESKEETLVRWFVHIKRMEDKTATRKVNEVRSVKKKRKGRTRKICQKEIRTALKKIGVKVQEITSLTQDRRD